MFRCQRKLGAAARRRVSLSRACDFAWLATGIGLAKRLRKIAPRAAAPPRRNLFMDARFTGFDGGTFGIRSVRVCRVAAILAVACLVGFTTPGPATAVLVSRDGTYYTPSLPDAADSVVQSCPNDVCATLDVSGVYEPALESAISSLEPFMAATPSAFR
jgi:hypothetical protein